MSLFGSIKESIKGHFEQRKENQVRMDKLRREANSEYSKIFQEEFKLNSREVVKAKAKKDAAEKSGLQKLRATNRSRNLSGQGIDPGTFFGKFSDYTKGNIARREENLKKTEELRKVAKEDREKQMKERVTQRASLPSERKTFGKSTWKM